MRTYSGMILESSFLNRFNYLKLSGSTGIETFGFNRYVNQEFYKSRDWKQVRHLVIARDEGCDLGILDRPIHEKILVHHIDPITEEDILYGSAKLLDPDNLVTTTLDTHNAIHYGDTNLLIQDYVPRTPGDTNLW